MNKRLKNNKGATLLEIILVVAISSLIILPIIGTFIGAYKAFYQEDEQITLINDGRKAMDLIMTDIRSETDYSNILIQDKTLTLTDVEYTLIDSRLVALTDSGEETISNNVHEFNISQTNAGKKVLSIELVMSGKQSEYPYKIQNKYTLRY